MYKIKKVKISGFWKRFETWCEFNNDVNIIIGRNGAGKTTYMNILHSILSVDVESLNDHDFKTVEITLSKGKKTKKITVSKEIDLSGIEQYFEYKISTRKFKVRAIPWDERRIPLQFRRRFFEESKEIRNELLNIISLSTLSVYRLRSGEDFEVNDRNGYRAITPVDFRLSQLLQRLTSYQLDLLQKAREVASELQKEVLVSILYSREDSKKSEFGIDFDIEKEKENLTSAYRQLNASTAIASKIKFHVEAINATVMAIKNNKVDLIDIKSIEAYRKTQKIIKMSLESERKTSEIFNPINLFISTISKFITNKEFTFVSGELTISNEFGHIDNNVLSSGEKQLLILFIEVLLQKSLPYVFLTDEPELSLHISWQREIIPAIRKLNENAQIIVATHSPEVAAKYKSSIIKMEDIICG